MLLPAHSDYQKMFGPHWPDGKPPKAMKSRLGGAGVGGSGAGGAGGGAAGGAGGGTGAGGKTGAEDRAAGGNSDDDGDGDGSAALARKKQPRLPPSILSDAVAQRMLRHGVPILCKIGSFCFDLHLPYEAQHHQETAAMICFGVYDDDHEQGMNKLNFMRPTAETLKVSVEVAASVLEALARTLFSLLMKSDPLASMSERYRKRQEKRKLYWDDDDSVRTSKLKGVVQQARLLQKQILPEVQPSLERTVHIGKQHQAFSRMRRHSAAKIGQWAMKKVRKNRERKRLLDAEMPAYMRRQRAAIQAKKKK